MTDTLKFTNHGQMYSEAPCSCGAYKIYHPIGYSGLHSLLLDYAETNKIEEIGRFKFITDAWAAADAHNSGETVWLREEQIPTGWHGKSVWKFGPNWISPESSPYILEHSSQGLLYALAAPPEPPIEQHKALRELRAEQRKKGEIQ